MPFEDELWKAETGLSYEKLTRLPSLQEVEDLAIRQLHSSYPLRSLGTGLDEEVLISEEQRTHTHIMGTTRVGKSKFLEYLIRGDIDRGQGVCFIDSSEGGQTAYNILRYCASIGHQKVIFIDPLHTYLFKRIAPIDVFGDSPDESAEKVWDIIQIQFQQKESTETPVIKQYLPAIIRVLHEAGMTLSEAIYFTQPAYIEQREEIFARARRLKNDVLMLRSAFSNRDIYREYRPTGRRILDVLHPVLNLYMGSTTALDFTRIVADKWVVIANLYPKKFFGKSAARFLGTAIINEIINAMDSLTGDPLEDHWKGRFYLYIDEVGRYANRNLANVLDHKGKTGLFLTLAHQRLNQIEDFYVRDAILNQTSTKIVFRLESAEDTHRIAKQIYGGGITDRDAAKYINGLPKQHCVVKLPALDARSVMVPTVWDIEVDLKEYLNQIYSQSCYIPIEQIEREQGIRVVTYEIKPSYESPRRSNQPSQKASKTTHRPNSKVAAPRRSPDPPTESEDPFRSLREDEISYSTNAEE